MKDFSTIFAPLTEIIKKSIGFKWGEEQNNAFQDLKNKLCSAPVLSLLDFNKTFEIECDASDISIGVVLMQERRRVIFEPGDWVWVHMRKERFPTQRKSKLAPRGDGPFQVIQRINGNAYKVDLLGKYSVSDTFNVADLSPYVAREDSKSNPFKERGDDKNQELKFNQPQAPAQINNPKDALQIPSAPITRSRAQKLKEALIGLIQDILTTQTNLILNLSLITFRI